MPAHVLHHRGLVHRVAKQRQLRLNPRRSPRGVLPRHTPNQAADHRVDSGATALASRLPAPVQPEALAVPAKDGVWLDDHEARSPVSPESRQQHPEDSITLPKSWAFHRPLQDPELMTQREVLGCDGGAVCDERSEDQEDRRQDAHFASSVRVL